VSSTAAEVVQFAQTWGAVIGLGFDIVGATFVYLSVRTTLREAFLLERQAVVGETTNDISAPELLAKNESFKRDRVRERTRASRIGWWGLVCFVLGFALQAISAWPNAG